MRNFRRLLENLIDGYILDPILRQELLVNFLLVYLEFQPNFYWKDTDLDFVQGIEDLGFQVIIKDDVSIVVNPKHSRIKSQSNIQSDEDIFQSVFVFERNGIETKHLIKWYNPVTLEEHLPRIAFRLNDIYSSNQFSDFKVFLNVSCKNNF
jgi:hypothetical protein